MRFSSCAKITSARAPVPPHPRGTADSASHGLIVPAHATPHLASRGHSSRKPCLPLPQDRRVLILLQKRKTALPSPQPSPYFPDNKKSMRATQGFPTSIGSGYSLLLSRETFSGHRPKDLFSGSPSPEGSYGDCEVSALLPSRVAFAPGDAIRPVSARLPTPRPSRSGHTVSQPRVIRIEQQQEHATTVATPRRKNSPRERTRHSGSNLFCNEN